MSRYHKIPLSEVFHFGLIMPGVCDSIITPGQKPAEFRPKKIIFDYKFY